MVKFYHHDFRYEHPWHNVTLAFWLRYPNPYTAHVLSVDVLDRSVDPETGVLRTTRLILKKGVLPRWAPKGIMNKTEAYILEESEVDPKTLTMRTKTRNITHDRVMRVEETQTFRSISPADGQDDGSTLVTTEARVISRFGWGLANRIEMFGATKFADNTARARQGMSWVLEMIREKQLLRRQTQ